MEISANWLSDRALAYARRGDLNGARALLLAGIEADPRLFWRTRYLLQQILVRTGGADELIGILDHALSEHPQLNHSVDQFDQAAFDAMKASRDVAIYNDKPPMLFAMQTHSASATIAHELISGFGIQPGNVTAQLDPFDRVVPSWARDFARGGLLSGPHMDGVESNLRTLADAGISKIVVHVRDPRATLISNLHHMARQRVAHADVASMPWRIDLDYSAPLTDQVDAYVRRGRWRRSALYWLLSWLDAEKRQDEFGIKIMFTRYDDFMLDKRAMYDSVLRFFDIDPARFLFDHAAASTASDLHFREGEIGGWRKHVRPDQAERLTAMTPPSIFNRFGWS